MIICWIIYGVTGGTLVEEDGCVGMDEDWAEATDVVSDDEAGTW